MTGHCQSLRKHPRLPVAWVWKNTRYCPKTGRVWYAARDRFGRFGGWVADRSGGYGYRVLQPRVGGPARSLRSHHVAFVWMTGDYPSQVVDHVNGDRADNRWSNLRDVSNRQNVCFGRSAGLVPGITSRPKGWLVSLWFGPKRRTRVCRCFGQAVKLRAQWLSDAAAADGGGDAS